MRAPDGRTAAGAPQGAFEESPGSTEARVPGNARRVRTQGKCNRKQTADAPARGRARLKWCGKSAPRPRQRGWHGKPHPEQDQIGATRMGWLAPAGAGLLPGRRPGRSREAPGDRRPRGMVVARSPERGTEPGLQTVWHFLPACTRLRESGFRTKQKHTCISNVCGSILACDGSRIAARNAIRSL